jgi:hypothetical protein
MQTPIRRLLILAAIPTLGLLGSSCNDSGGGDGASGNSTVIGQVSNFNGTVVMDGTGLKANVANGGVFVMSGAPEGVQTLTFTQTGAAGLAVGSSAKLQVNVPANSTVSLGTVKVDDNSARPSSVKVTTNPGAAVKLRGDGSVDDSQNGASTSDDTNAAGVKLRGDGTVDDNGADDANDDNGGSGKDKSGRDDTKPESTDD